MSSYGIEVEIWRPVYFDISSIKIQSSSTGNVLRWEAPPTLGIKIGPERDAENQALYRILNIIYRTLLENAQPVSTTIRDAILKPENFGTLRLNRSPIRFDSIEMAAATFHFSELSPDEIMFLLHNIIFSIDHGYESQMVLELVTNPVGRYKYPDKLVFTEQAHFLEVFFKFCKALKESPNEYTLPCSIDWHDPHTWQITDTAQNPWDYTILLEGMLKISGPPAGFRPQEDSQTWGFSFPQYNFSIDLSHFTLAQSFSREASLESIIQKKYDFINHDTWMDSAVRTALSGQDPLLYFYALCNVDHDLIKYNMCLTELSRMIVHQMCLATHKSTNPPYENEKTTIIGAFGYTIWYFLSLCVGGFEGNLLHKNLFLFMPKTSPIPFLKAAYVADPEYYHHLLSNMTQSFCFVLFHSLKYNQKFCRTFSQYLTMKYFFPRLARWYRAGRDKIELATPASDRESNLRDYSNPLPQDLPQSVHDLHNLVLAFGGQYLAQQSDPFLHDDEEQKGVLAVLIQFIQLTFIAASQDYRTLIRLRGPNDLHKKGIEVLGTFLTAQDANQIPVYAQPGFGRPKLEARITNFMPRVHAGIINLVSALNVIGRPTMPISSAFSETANLPPNIDQISVDLTLSNMGDGNSFRTNRDPWESDEYKYVWMPGKQEFGRRKEADIKRWLTSTDEGSSPAHTRYTFDLPPVLPKQETEIQNASDASKISMAKVSDLLEINPAFLNTIVNLM